MNLRRNKPDFVPYIVVGLVGVSIAVLLLLPVINEEHGPPDRRADCQNHLKQIGISLRNYVDVYGSLPPAYVADENGTPLYSWRVLILPIIQETELHQAFDRSQPWDSPVNQGVSETPLEVFRCPSAEAAAGDQLPDNVTNYLAVVGPNTAWRGSQPVSEDELGDDLSELILLVEVADSKIPWAKPKDLRTSSMVGGINTSTTNGISSHHVDGVCVLFADGHVEYLPDNVSPEDVEAMLTIPEDERDAPTNEQGE